MSTVDIAVVAIILVSLLVGLCRGVIREVLSLLSWIVALWAAYRYAQPGGVYFESYIDQPPLRIVAAFAAIFVMALIAASFLGYLVRRVLSSSGISGIDRSLGMLFGIVRGAIIVAVLILTAIFMDMTTQPWWEKSLLVNYFTPITDMLRSLMPQGLEIYFQRKDGLG